MSVKPILFNTEMVRAILDGRKTCTRRVVKLPKNMSGRPVGKNGDIGLMYLAGIKRPPYQPGDIIYIRETWGTYSKNWWEADYFMYRADYPNGATTYTYSDGIVCDLPKWCPSIHMPKEAARIWLKVTDVRAERLQGMTDDDAEAEGCFDYTSTALGFPDVWDSTIKKSDLDRYSWQANPWVWVIEFERCEKPKEG